MSERLAELRRQRALVQEHLAWLDREIAASSPPSAPEPAAPSAAPPPPVRPTVQPTALRQVAPPAARLAATSNSAPVDADSILEQYRTAPGSLQSDVRKGCLLYFAGALALLALGVTALSFLIGRR